MCDLGCAALCLQVRQLRFFGAFAKNPAFMFSSMNFSAFLAYFSFYFFFGPEITTLFILRHIAHTAFSLSSHVSRPICSCVFLLLDILAEVTLLTSTSCGLQKSSFALLTAVSFSLHAVADSTSKFMCNSSPWPFVDLSSQ